MTTLEQNSTATGLEHNSTTTGPERTSTTAGLERTPTTAGAGRDHGLAYWAVSDCWNITRRVLTHYQRRPSAVIWQLGFPILSVLLTGTSSAAP